MAELEFSDPRRLELLQHFKQLFFRPVPPTTWALFWLADIPVLERLLKNLGQVETSMKNASLVTLFNFNETYKLTTRCTFCFLSFKCPARTAGPSFSSQHEEALLTEDVEV